jgi:hypothetical protein
MGPQFLSEALMTWCRASVYLFCLLTAVAQLPAFGQSPGYHFEYSDGPMNHPESHWVTFVGNSDKPIEAYEMREQKLGGEFCAERRCDILDNPGLTPLERGEKWDYGYLSWGPDGKECEPRADAVIFADGSYEGNEAVVRALMADRDGVAAALNHWSQEISAKKPGASSLDELLDEAESRINEDRPEQPQHPPSLSGADETEALPREYWRGRYMVDRFVNSELSTAETNDVAMTRSFLWILRSVETWRTKINTSLSMKMLNIKFPPTTEPAEILDDGSEHR